MYSLFNLGLYFILAVVFGPGAGIFFHFYSDFYAMSKWEGLLSPVWPIFDIITPEWLLLLGFGIFWTGCYYTLSFYYELQKFLNRPPKLDWWQQSVIYQIYVKSFYDSNNDGTGDLKGVTKKLDYLNHIGIKSIWLSPFYPSGGKDGGYDVTSYTEIDPVYGSMADFDELIDKAHEKGMHVIMDFIPNHTSNEHSWFKESCKSGEASNPYRDFYIWFPSEDSVHPPNNWRSVFGQSAWTYCESRRAWYLHQFLKEQPDLNFRCPAVHEKMREALRFWLEKKGVDGFRIDAFKHIYKSADFTNEPPSEFSIPTLNKELAYTDLDHPYTTNQPETYQLLAQWKEMFEEIGKKTNSTKALIVECSYTDVKELTPYYKRNNNKLSSFPFNFQFIGLNKQTGVSFTPKEIKRLIENYRAALPKDCWPNWQIGNHDNARISTRIGQENTNLANVLNLLLGGTSVMYYGEELGMEDLPVDMLSFEASQDEFGRKYGPIEFMKYSRDYARIPMLWSGNKDSQFGFTQAKSTWLPVSPQGAIKNVQTQLKDSESCLSITMNLLNLRQLPSFQWGKLSVHVVTDQIFSFLRRAYDFPAFLVVMNISDVAGTVALETNANIAPRAYVSTYIPGIKKVSELSKIYTQNAPVLTNNVTLNARDCLILTWSG